jgi:hypothetical protein
MSHSTLQVLSIPTPATPRGAIAVGAIYRVFSALFGRTRANVSRRTTEAAAVREMARELQHRDPSFASDLMAAAARHEALDDDGPLHRR